VSRKHVNCITVNTDASFHPEKKIGGYAFHIVCDAFKIKKGGAFKDKLKNSMDAEMKCMVNALHILSNVSDIPTTNWIVVNSDCLNSFEKIKLKSSDPIGRQIAKLMRDIRIKCEKNGVKPKFEFRHVKAHNGRPDSRSHVNHWCDKEARRHMREKLKTLEK
jgi:ribonuclease HI